MNERKKRKIVFPPPTAGEVFYIFLYKKIYLRRGKKYFHKKRNDVFQNQILFLKLLTTKWCRIQRCFCVYIHIIIYLLVNSIGVFIILWILYTYNIYKKWKIQLHLNNTHISCTMVLHFSDEIHNECKLNNSR